MAVPAVSHPASDVAGALSAPLKAVSPVASATLPYNLPLLGDAPQLGLHQLQNLAPGSSFSSTAQPFRPPSNPPQPFQAAKASPSTPSPAVNPTDVPSTSAPSAPKVAPVVAGMGTLPPTVADASGSAASASSSGFAASDGLRAIPTNKNNPAFLNKLRSMVDDPNTDELIRWSPDGASFFVPNHVRFGDEVLPRFFKHNRFSSFVRQLNMYGFHKVPHLQQGALKHDSPQESELWEFSNPHFHRDHPDWLSKVQRKKGPRDDKDTHAERETSNSTGQELMHAGALMRTDFGVDGNSDGALQLASVLNAINAIKNAQTSISADLRHLQNSNQNLWQEAVESRQRAKRQQETINKILRFLAGVFGNQDDAATPVPGKKVSGKGRGGRRVGVRPQQQQRGKSRLMIEGGNASSSTARRLEGLDLPLDQEEIEEMPSHLRFQDASNADSPKGQSPSANNGGSRFTQIGSLPSSSSAADFGRQLSEAVSTPGGSRRLSSQASNQVLNALASGEGNAWLASLFGASLANQGSKSTGPASGGGLKLDPHMVAALQQALASAGGGGGGAGCGGDSGADYFGGANSAQPDDFSSRFSAFPNNDSSNSSGSSSGQQSSSSGSGNGLGLDADAIARIAGISQALVQSPARQNLNAAAPSNYTVTSPSKGQSTANLFDSSSINDDAVGSSSANNQQLALSLSRAARDLQNTSSDVDQVQNSINSLIEGLQTNPNLLQSITGQAAPAAPAATGAAVPWQNAGGDASAAFGGATGFGDASGAGAASTQFAGPTGTTPPSSSTGAGAGAGAGANPSLDSDFDVDSFLSQFVDTSQAPGGGVTSPSANNAFGESPSFAFSPATTAAFLHGAGANDAPGIYAHEVASGTNSGTSSNSANSPLESGPWKSAGGKKRKPSTSTLSPNSMDVNVAARPVKKSAASRKA
ncbi:related to Heat shock factor protein [Sporisorium reilianum f. sp. reilianum]|uniref:Related to Heat shock factor protein n=1 Tax=Sporisorium reilianum f. sp. reilianum TaxID=72559 RepID=A0A2N8UE68_9BASI|nr:related to Heat shock factor protein [Sporisorium reilianum f. sp. reilianum]